MFFVPIINAKPERTLHSNKQCVTSVVGLGPSSLGIFMDFPSFRCLDTFRFTPKSLFWVWGTLPKQIFDIKGSKVNATSSKTRTGCFFPVFFFLQSGFKGLSFLHQKSPVGNPLGAAGEENGDGSAGSARARPGRG